MGEFAQREFLLSTSRFEGFSDMQDRPFMPYSFEDMGLDVFETTSNGQGFQIILSHAVLLGRKQNNGPYEPQLRYIARVSGIQT